MSKSREATEGLQSSILAIAKMKEYDVPDAPTREELTEVAKILESANTKYHEAELATPGEIDSNEFLKVVQNLVSVLSDLKSFDNALDVLGAAIKVRSLKESKEAEINELIVTLAFNKANAITTANGDADDIIAAADIGLAIEDSDENLHYLKALAYIKKGETDNAIAEFVYLKNSTTAELRDYANNTVKSLLTKQAIDAISTGDTFSDFIDGKDIGNDAKDWLTEEDLADNIASYARFKYAPTEEQVRDEGATIDKSLGCQLMNAVIGAHTDAQDTLHAMATGGQASSDLLGEISGATDPLATDFTTLTWA